MKKILTLIITLTFVFSLGACNNAPTEYDTRIDELETQNEEQAKQIDYLIDYLDRQVFQGYMLPEGSLDASANETFYVSRMGYQYLMLTDKDKVDITKFPTYIWDVFDNYYSAEDVGELLIEKYLGVSVSVDANAYFTFRTLKPVDMSVDEYVVRLSMLVMELSYYDFYLLDSNYIMFVMNEGASQSIRVKTSMLTTDKYDGVLHPSMFWEGLFDTKIEGMTLNVEQMELIYANIKDDIELQGYVLPNFK